MDSCIRPALATDLDAVATLHAESWRHAYRGLLPDALLDGDLYQNRRQLWAPRLQGAEPARHTYLVERDGQALGFVSLLLDADATHGHLIDNLHVHRDAQGQGWGRALLRTVATIAQSEGPARPLYLFVLDGNFRAARFYEAHGARHIEALWDDHVPGMRILDHRYRWPDAAALLSQTR